LNLKISIHNINKKFKLKKNPIKKLIRLIFSEEKRLQGEIGLIFVDHDYMIKLNKKFLQQKNSTDVLSFPLEEEDSSALIGEIYINLDKVIEQASDYNITYLEEMNRIIIHGLLHLLGYNDQTRTDKVKMTDRENYYLKIIEREDSKLRMNAKGG